MEELEKRPFFTTKEAEAVGVSRRMLSYYMKKGVFERIGKGIVGLASKKSKMTSG